jgi:hypothetical protein
MLISEDLRILPSNYSYHSSMRETMGLNWILAQNERSLVNVTLFRRRLSLPYIGSVNYKCKVRPRTGYADQERKKRYRSTLSLTSELGKGWVVNATSRPLYPRERDPVPIVQEAGYTLGSDWTPAEYLTSTRIQSPDSPARKESLSRPTVWTILPLNCTDPEDGSNKLLRNSLRCFNKQHDFIYRKTWLFSDTAVSTTYIAKQSCRRCIRCHHDSVTISRVLRSSSNLCLEKTCFLNLTDIWLHDSLQNQKSFLYSNLSESRHAPRLAQLPIQLARGGGALSPWGNTPGAWSRPFTPI